MSIVAGIVDGNGTIYMGYDAITAADTRSATTEAPKVFKRGQLLVGFVGSWRVGDILYGHLPSRGIVSDDEPAREVLIRSFIPTLMDLLRKNGGRREWCPETELLIGYRGELFHVDNAFHVSNDSRSWAAIGQGTACDAAIGAFYALERAGSGRARWRLRVALEAAVENSEYVREPITIRRLGRR